MNLQTVADILVFIALPATTLFPILYAMTAPWRRSLIGWAVMTAKTGLALLVGASALFRSFGPEYVYREYVVIFAFAVIVAGSWLYLFALIREQYLKRYRRTQ